MFIVGEMEEVGNWDKKRGRGGLVGVMVGTEKHSDRGKKGGWTG